MDGNDETRAQSSAERASRREGVGSHLEAAALFREAADSVEDLAKGLPWLNQAAINYRLAGREHYDASADLFNQVIRHTDDEALRDRACRDLGMLYADMNNISRARELMTDALKGQHGRGDTVEQAVTRGFIGRLDLLEGNRTEAYRAFREADQLLRNRHDVYELNNLIWMMKVGNVSSRFSLSGRAIRLAYRTGMYKRAIEAIILMLSPSLYARLRG